MTETTAGPQAVFDALASPVRREILWLTWGREMAAGEIGRHFALTGPTLSSHLAALRRAGLVTMRVDGTFRRYRCDEEAVRTLVPLLATSDDRWLTADDIPERGLASAQRGLVVTTAVDVPIEPEAAFEAFVDERRYSAWLGVPVTIRDGRFRTTLEWGTEVRGTYEVVSPPDLIAMRWDFDDETVPVPGRQIVAYLRVHPHPPGSRVEVHQLADDETHAAFLTDAWSTVLGRFAAAHARADGRIPPRSPRPKRHARPGST